MQAAYVDKYEEELKKAVEKATYLPSILQNEVPSYRYIGAVDGKYGKTHYYKKGEDTYYFESDFSREMRLKIRNNRFKNYTKK